MWTANERFCKVLKQLDFLFTGQTEFYQQDEAFRTTTICAIYNHRRTSPEPMQWISHHDLQASLLATSICEALQEIRCRTTSENAGKSIVFVRGEIVEEATTHFFTDICLISNKKMPSSNHFCKSISP